MNNEHALNSTISILIVDDMRENLRLLSDLLSGCGYQVRPTLNGEQALASVRIHPPDLILLDIMMPGLDGYEVCRRLKADEQTRDIPVLFISALNDTYDKVSAFELGGVDYITKPFQAREVLARVHTHLSLRQAQQQLHAQNVQLQQEIATRKQTEHALRKSQQLLEKIITSLEEVVLVLDPVDLTVILCNPVVERIFGYDESEIAGQTLRRFYADEAMYAHVSEDLSAALNAHENFHAELEMRRCDGNGLICELSATAIEDEAGQQKALVLVARDITERQQMLTRLRQSEEFHRNIISVLPDDLTVIDLAGRIIFASPQCAVLFGLPPEFEFLGTPVIDWFDPSEQAAVSERIQTLHIRQTAIEYKMRTYYGGYFWAEISSVAMSDAQGCVTGIMSLIRDITVRKQAEEELAEERKLLQTVIDLLPDYIFVKDLACRFMLNNAAHLRALNVTTQADVFGKTDFDCFPPELAAQYAADERRVLQTKQPLLDYEESSITAAGERQWLLTTKIPLPNRQGAVIGIVGSSRNITSLKQIQAALQKSVERYRRLVEYSPDAIAVHHAGRILYVNAAGIKLIGAAQATDLIGKAVMDVVHPDYVSSATEQLRITYEERVPIPLRAGKLIRLDGQTVDIEIVSAPISYQDTEATQVVIRDVSERKRMEDALRAAHQELQEKNAQLVELNASKDKFFSIIAHDLRSPFNALLGYIGIMTQHFDSLPPDKVKEYLDKVQMSADRLFALLENLLTWARMQRGLVQYTPETFALADIVDDIRDLFMSNAEQKQLTLTSAVPKALLVSVDYAMINTVMRNLVSNALKFTPVGGSIRIAAQLAEPLVEVAVTDTGKGMREDVIAKLFRIDTQYTTSGTDGETGTGLGLILCYDLVRKNGGALWVESEVGRGTTFRFTLPAATAEMARRRAEAATAPPSQTDLPVSAAAPKPEITPPGPAQLAALLNAVKLGDIMGIRQICDELPQQDLRFAAFAEHVKRFAHTLQMDAMREFITAYMR